MPDTTTENLGRVITRLGLEDKFLQNGHLQQYPLAQRAALANEIIAEKLRIGRWSSVVQMIWGGLGKADVLYEGDRNQLRQQILESAGKDSEEHVDSEILTSLARQGEHDFIFDIATKTPGISYKGLKGIWEYLPRGYFEGPEGEKRANVFDQAAGEKAMAEGNYENAFHYFRKTRNLESLTKVFEQLMEQRMTGYHNIGILQAIAESEPSKTEERLRRIFTDFLAGKINFSISSALSIQESLGSSVSDEERAKFQDLAVNRLSRYDLGMMVDKKQISPELQLLWAKKHATEEPRISYRIFKQQKYQGEEVQASVLKGLQFHERSRDSVEGLSEEKVNPEDLRAVYDKAPFEIKTRIARQLKDESKLTELSQMARKKGDLKQAYRLWLESGSSLEGEYINSLRARLIQDEIDENSKSRFILIFHFLDYKDKPGHAQAFDFLMQKAKGKNKVFMLSAAYELMRGEGESEQLQIVREGMIALNPYWALKNFNQDRFKVGRDEIGFESALSVISQRDGVDKEQLRPIIAKYGI